MKTIKMSNQFIRDLKRVKRRGKVLSKLDYIVIKLSSDQKLEQKYKEHKLIGNYKGKLECHIESDWLLIYETSETDVILYRTGSHSDLFE